MPHQRFWNRDVLEFSSCCAKAKHPQLFAWRAKDEKGLFPCNVSLAGRQSNNVVFDERECEGGTKKHWFTTKDGRVQGCLGPCKRSDPQGLIGDFYAFATSQEEILREGSDADVERGLQRFNQGVRSAVRQERLIASCVQRYSTATARTEARPWGEDYFSEFVAIRAPHEQTPELARRIALALYCDRDCHPVAQDRPCLRGRDDSWHAWADATDRNGTSFRVGIVRPKEASQKALIIIMHSDALWRGIMVHPLPRTSTHGWTVRQMDEGLCAESIAGYLDRGWAFVLKTCFRGDLETLVRGIMQCMHRGVKQAGMQVCVQDTSAARICTGTLVLFDEKGRYRDDLIVQAIVYGGGASQEGTMRVISCTYKGLWEDFCRVAAENAGKGRWSPPGLTESRTPGDCHPCR